MGFLLQSSRARLSTVPWRRSIDFIIPANRNCVLTALAARGRHLSFVVSHVGGSPRELLQHGGKECISQTLVWRDGIIGKSSVPRQKVVQPSVERKMQGLHRQLKPAENLLVPSSSFFQLQSTKEGVPVQTDECFDQEGQLERELGVLSRKYHGQEVSLSSIQMCISLLKECVKRKDLFQVKRVQAHLFQYGLESNKILGKNLVAALVRCGGLKDALQVFHRLPQRTVSSWTAMICGYVTFGQPQEALKMYEIMQLEGVQPNSYTLVNLLKACGHIGNLEEAKRIHAEAVKYRCARDLFVSTCLVDIYAKCGSIMDAQNVFDEMFEHDVVSWTAMLAAYVAHGQAWKALELYEQMLEESVSPNNRTIVVLLQACGLNAEEYHGMMNEECSEPVPLDKGRVIHVEARRKGYDLDVFVGSSLISMYGKFGYTVDARHVFDGLCKQDVVLWNSMLSVYVQRDQPAKVLQLYAQMQEEGVSADDSTYVSILQACGMLADIEEEAGVDERCTKLWFLKMGKEIHASARRKNFDSDVFVGSTLISLYGKCGSLSDAEIVFSRLSQQNVVSWNTLLVAYAQHGEQGQALEVYRQMREKDTLPDDITLLCVLRVCSDTGALDICRQIHGGFLDGNEVIHQVANSLIHAYGKCSSMVDAQNVFNALPRPDVVSWNALIAGYAHQGNVVVGLQCFKEMRLHGIKPDGITFLSLLCICSRAGRVDEGVTFFEVMSRDYGIAPQIEHYGCMVDLLGRAGCFERAEEFLLEMPMQPDVALWLCLLSACQKHGEVAMAEQAFENAVRLQPTTASAYLLTSNIYADAGLWNCAREVRKLRQTEDASKLPARSWIEQEQGVQMFWVEDRRHRRTVEIYDLLDMVSWKLSP